MLIIRAKFSSNKKNTHIYRATFAIYKKKI